MIHFLPYSPQHEVEWNSFNSTSVNGNFLFDRKYMDYHQDRFVDASLMVYDDTTLVALLPGNRVGNEFQSHGGLTFGGFVVAQNLYTPAFMEMFSLYLSHLKSESYEHVLYKPSPFIYHVKPFQADLYALFRHNAVLTGRLVTVSIKNSLPIRLHAMKNRNIAHAKQSSVLVTVSKDIEQFYTLLDHRLMERYHSHPVHSLNELRALMNNFPENIKLFTAVHLGEIVAGVVIYESACVAHCQYIASSDVGRQNKALDLLFQTLILHYKDSKEWFDFGTSNEEGGLVLNESLILSKERFDAHPVVHDVYSIQL